MHSRTWPVTGSVKAVAVARAVAASNSAVGLEAVGRSKCLELPARGGDSLRGAAREHGKKRRFFWIGFGRPLPLAICTGHAECPGRADGQNNADWKITCEDTV